MKIKNNNKRIPAIACLIVAVVLVVSATVDALPNEQHSNQIRNDGYIIVIEKHWR